MSISTAAVKYDLTFNGLEIVLPLSLQQPFKSIMLGRRFIATAGIEPTIALYPIETWELITFELQRLPSINPQVRNLQRILVGQATEIAQKSSSSIELNTALKRHAGIRKHATALLFPNKIEIWNPNTLSCYLERPKYLTRSGLVGILRGGDDKINETLLHHLCPQAVICDPSLTNLAEVEHRVAPNSKNT